MRRREVLQDTLLGVDAGPGRRRAILVLAVTLSLSSRARRPPPFPRTPDPAISPHDPIQRANANPRADGPRPGRLALLHPPRHHRHVQQPAQHPHVPQPGTHGRLSREAGLALLSSVRALSPPPTTACVRTRDFSRTVVSDLGKRGRKQHLKVEIPPSIPSSAHSSLFSPHRCLRADLRDAERGTGVRAVARARGRDGRGRGSVRFSLRLIPLSIAVSLLLRFGFSQFLSLPPSSAAAVAFFQAASFCTSGSALAAAIC